MARIDLDLDEMLDGFTRDGMKKFVKRLITANDAEEKKLLSQLNRPAKNELADLDEEMHGKPNVPEVTDDDMPREGLADIPKKGKKNG